MANVGWQPWGKHENCIPDPAASVQAVPVGVSMEVCGVLSQMQSIGESSASYRDSTWWPSSLGSVGRCSISLQKSFVLSGEAACRG